MISLKALTFHLIFNKDILVGMLKKEKEKSVSSEKTNSTYRSRSSKKSPENVSKMNKKNGDLLRVGFI